MRILVGCETSGRVREAFRAKGHEAISYDLLPSDDNSPFHVQGDVLGALKEKWDMAIFHPTCTYLTNSGVTWLHRDITRWPKLFEGAEFFKVLLNADIPKIAVENPIMHKYSRSIIGVRPTQIIQPWMFGHAESKATCLWLKNLPPLVETNNVKKQFLALPKKEAQRLHYLPPGPERWKERSKTFQGIADAMADQWAR